MIVNYYINNRKNILQRSTITEVIIFKNIVE